MAWVDNQGEQRDDEFNFFPRSSRGIKNREKCNAYCALRIIRIFVQPPEVELVCTTYNTKMTKYVMGLKKHGKQKKMLVAKYTTPCWRQLFYVFHPSKQKFIKLLKYLHDFSKAPSYSLKTLFIFTTFLDLPS